MKKILQICAFGAPNGGNFIESLLKLQDKMKQEGYETIYAFCETAKNREWCKKLEENNKVYFLPVAKARILPKTYLIIKNIFSENNVTIVHSHFELYDIPVTFMAPSNVRVYWHLHDPIEEYYHNGKLSRKLLMKLQYTIFGRKTVLISVSKTHANFVQKLGFNSKNIFYIPNAISFNRLENKNSTLYNNNFLMFGWEVYRKGVDLAVEAERLLQNKNFKLYVVGQEKCKQFLDSECNSKNITFANPVDDVTSLYSKTKVFLHLSRAEGLSYGLLEAIYFGMYVICSDIPENQFAREFKGIEFFRSGDVKQLSTLIDKYIPKKNISLSDISYNRNLILKKYSLDNWCNKIIDIYGRY